MVYLVIPFFELNDKKYTYDPKIFIYYSFDFDQDNMEKKEIDIYIDISWDLVNYYE